MSAAILVTSFGIVLTVGALSALSQVPTDATTAQVAAFEGAFWGNLQSLTNLFGEAFFGLGLLLTARLAWSSHRLPRWLIIVILIGGVAAFPAMFIDSLAILPFGAFTILCLVSGIIIWRFHPSAAT